jgi:Tfp pilus assembly protein PilF
MSFRNFVLIVSLFALGSQEALAETVATLYSAQGPVEEKSSGSSAWRSIATGAQFEPLDSVRTKRHSRAAIRLREGYLIRLRNDTMVTFTQSQSPNGQQSISLSSGASYFFSRTNRKYPKIKTPHVTAAVRGTEFIVSVFSDKTLIEVLDGAVEADNAKGSVSLGPGERAIIKAGQAPVKSILLNPEDAVQWAISFPALLDPNDLGQLISVLSPEQKNAWDEISKRLYGTALKVFSGTTWVDRLARARIKYEAGDLDAAIAEISVESPEAPATYFLYKASLLFASGSPEDAIAALKTAKVFLEKYSFGDDSKLASLLQSYEAMVALSRNRKQDARALAKSAILGNPTSTNAMLAMSLVSQAEFDLTSAEEWLKRAIENSPNNIYATTRLAELQLGRGRLKEATKTIELARKLQGDYGYALTTEGFIWLSRKKTEKAIELFDLALTKGADGALAHLGRGLAFIYQGELKAGREEIENAVALDPRVSLYRSYLGKALFEEEREGKARLEYDRAIEIDPKDPTPYFYRSFLNLSTFRPIEALKDIEASIERNSNRAVFRSKLLVDQDSAVRGAGLAGVFQTLGFDEVARVEALKALQNDYQNFSAHNLLSSAYLERNNLAAAESSEIWLALALSPTTYNSLSQQGAPSASANEYTPLYDRPFQRNFVTLEHESEGDMLRGSARSIVYRDDAAYSLAYTYRNRNDNSFSEHSRVNVITGLTKHQLTEDTSMFVLAGGSAITDRTKLGENFGESSTFDSSDLRTQLVVGLNTALTPNSNILVQLYHNYENRDADSRNHPTRILAAVPVDLLDDDLVFTASKTNEQLSVRSNLFSGEVAYYQRSGDWSVLFGGRAQAANEDLEESAIIERLEPIFDPGGTLFSAVEGRQLRSATNKTVSSYYSYLYNTYSPVSWATAHAGISYSTIEFLSTVAALPPYTDETKTLRRWSPKIGLLIEPIEGLSVRASYFEGFGQGINSRFFQLEPTFVGGFNQSFDDLEFGKQEVYAVGADMKLPGSVYAGISYQERDVAIQQYSKSTGILVDTQSGDFLENISLDLLKDKKEERSVNSYLYAIISSTLALQANYSWFGNRSNLGDNRTHRYRAKLKHFHPSGFNASVSGIWRQQELDTMFGLFDEKEEFWHLDTEMGYQFSNRQGGVVLRFRNLLDEELGNYQLLTGEQELPGGFSADLRVALNF